MSNKAKIREEAMSLNPIDDALFHKMAEEKAFCQEILRVIIGDNKLTVKENIPQFSAKNLQGRSCIFDVRCLLGDGCLADVEVQRFNNDDCKNRVRYNASLLTTNTSNPGDDFRAIPRVIVIFIAKFDIFRAEKAVYHIKEIVEETDERYYDGLSKIYVNASADDKSDVAELMKIFTKNDVYNDKKFPITSASKRKFKTTEKGVFEMCEVIERNRREAAIEAAMEKTVEIALNLLQQNISIEVIASSTGLSIEFINKLSGK